MAAALKRGTRSWRNTRVVKQGASLAAKSLCAGVKW